MVDRDFVEYEALRLDVAARYAPTRALAEAVLLDAAAAAGARGFTTRDVAEASGVSNTTLRLLASIYLGAGHLEPAGLTHALGVRLGRKCRRFRITRSGRALIQTFRRMYGQEAS